MRNFKQTRYAAYWVIEWRRTGKSENVSADTYVYFSVLTGKGEKGTASIIVNSDGGGNAGENSAISIDLRSVGVKPTEYTYAAGASV